MLAARCLDAARAAEDLYRLPQGILVAIAIVESALHPYAVGGPGTAQYAQGAEQAIRLARTLGPRTSGGCVQVNIGVHAARNAGWVFDPPAAARFAAAHLRDSLRADGTRAEDWAGALARYNGGGAGTASGRAYACRVREAAAAFDQVTANLIRPGRCRAEGAIRQKAETLLAMANTAPARSPVAARSLQ